jgi:hypothetical protein
MRLPSLWISFFALSLFAHAADGLKLKFKDGTTLSGAKIYVPTVKYSTGNPDRRGVILMFHDKLYIHHFPYRQPRRVMRVVDGGVDDGNYKIAAVMEELEHYQARASALEPSPRELIYSCTPSRLAFFHFDQPSLNVLRQAISTNTGIPNANRKAALAAIQMAYNAEPAPAWYNTPRHSQIWQQEADRDVARYTEHVFYGKWIDQPALAPATFQTLLRTSRKRAP